MKKTIWSQPGVEWHGFEPVRYFLDTQKVARFPLVRVEDGADNGEGMTLLEALRSFKDQKIVSIDSSVGETEVVKTDSGTVRFKGVEFHRQLFKIMLDLENEGVNSFFAEWFYYENDHVRTDPQESYTFFIVADDKIVREQVMLFDADGWGFDPSVFHTDDETEAIWRRERDWAEANTRYWYRKFYKETRVGQLMVLRPDEPGLHHYAEGRFNEGEYSVALRTLSAFAGKMYLLLWALVIPLAILVLRR